MNDSDKSGFLALLNGLSDYYRQDKLTVIGVQIYFGTLKRFSLEQITTAASAHVGDVKSGQFYPKAADLIRHLEGGDITQDMIIAAAKLRDTPLGCFCAIHIGSWDLNNQDAFYLRQRASECLQLLPQWKERAAAGDYSSQEISVMLKYDIHPLTPFAFGLAAPLNTELLLERFNEVKASAEHARFIEPIHEHSEDDKTAPISEEVRLRIQQINEAVK